MKPQTRDMKRIVEANESALSEVLKEHNRDVTDIAGMAMLLAGTISFVEPKELFEAVARSEDSGIMDCEEKLEHIAFAVQFLQSIQRLATKKYEELGFKENEYDSILAAELLVSGLNEDK